jgi:hypothetical protein
MAYAEINGPALDLAAYRTGCRTRPGVALILTPRRVRFWFAFHGVYGFSFAANSHAALIVATSRLTSYSQGGGANICAGSKAR